MIEKFNSPPFEALIHLTASCYHGGKVTDDWDRRLLTETMTEFYNENILETFKKGLVDSPGYQILII